MPKQHFQADRGWQDSHPSCCKVCFQFQSHENSLQILDWNRLINWRLTLSVSSICFLGSSVTISAMWCFPARAEQPHGSNRCRTRAKLGTTWMWATPQCLSPSLPFLWHQLLSVSPRQIPKHWRKHLNAMHAHGKQHGLRNCFSGISEVSQGGFGRFNRTSCNIPMEFELICGTLRSLELKNLQP